MYGHVLVYIGLVIAFNWNNRSKAENKLDNPLARHYLTQAVSSPDLSETGQNSSCCFIPTDQYLDLTESIFQNSSVIFPTSPPTTLTSYGKFLMWIVKMLKFITRHVTDCYQMALPGSSRLLSGSGQFQHPCWGSSLAQTPWLQVSTVCPQ